MAVTDDDMRKVVEILSCYDHYKELCDLCRPLMKELKDKFYKPKILIREAATQKAKTHWIKGVNEKGETLESSFWITRFNGKWFNDALESGMFPSGKVTHYIAGCKQEIKTTVLTFKEAINWMAENERQMLEVNNSFFFYDRGQYCYIDGNAASFDWKQIKGEWLLKELLSPKEICNEEA